MAKMIFVNLPVADVARSEGFYAAIGCTKDERFSQAGTAVSMQWSDEIVFHLLVHDFYKTFLPHKDIADTTRTNAVLLALALDSREAVDAIVKAAAEGGGAGDVRPAQDLGFMYGRSFEDPDGHIFEPSYMDMEAAMAAFAGQPAEA